MEHEKGFSSLFQKSVDAQLLLRGGVCTDCNDAAISMMGCGRREELLGHPLDHHSPPLQPDGQTSLDKAKEMMAMALEKESHRFEWMCRGRDGTDLPVEVTLTAITARGELLLHALVRNVLEGHRVERALPGTELRYQDFAELLPQVLFEVDVRGRLTFVNNRGLAYFGYTREEFKKGISLAQVICPEDCMRALANMKRVLEGEKLTGTEYIAVRRDGSRFPVIISSTVILEGAKPVGLRGMVQDITERKRGEQALRESEERFRTLAEATLEGIAITEQGRIVDANEQLLQIIGTTRSELMGQEVAALVAPEDRDRVMAGIVSDLENHMEHRMFRRDGTKITVATHGRTIAHQGRQVRITAIRDITQRKEVEERLRASLKEKEVLLQEIHHRVKNNLQIISSLLCLQANRTGSTAVLSALRESQSRVKSMALIHERLYRSPNLASVDMGEYTKKLVSHLRHSYRTDHGPVRFTIDIDNIALDITEAIPCGLIINELVTNALKHAFPEGRSGEIAIQLIRGTEKQSTLTVKDDGIGLPGHVDFRNSPSLGLTLVNSLVTQLDGTIELEGTQGAAFRITFG